MVHLTNSLRYVLTRRCLGAWGTLPAVCLAPLFPALHLSSPSTQLPPSPCHPPSHDHCRFPSSPSLKDSAGLQHFSLMADPPEQGCSLLVPHAPRLQHQELCVSQTLTLTRPAQALGHFSTPRKPLLPGPASRDVYTTMVMSCAEELGAGLHDGAGEATALLEQGEARFGHVRCGGLLSPGSHFLLFDRSYGKRNRCLPGDKGTGPSLLLRAPFRARMLTLLRPTAGHPGGTSPCVLHGCPQAGHRHRDPGLEMPPTALGRCSSSNDGGTGKRVACCQRP